MLQRRGGEKKRKEKRKGQEIMISLFFWLSFLLLLILTHSSASFISTGLITRSPRAATSRSNKLSRLKSSCNAKRDWGKKEGREKEGRKEGRRKERELLYQNIYSKKEKESLCSWITQCMCLVGDVAFYTTIPLGLWPFQGGKWAEERVKGVIRKGRETCIQKRRKENTFNRLLPVESR